MRKIPREERLKDQIMRVVRTQRRRRTAKAKSSVASSSARLRVKVLSVKSSRVLTLSQAIRLQSRYWRRTR